MTVRVSGKLPERRRYPRAEVKVQVTFRRMEDLIQEYTRNISRGGIFLRTEELLDPNAEIELTMVFPDDFGSHRVRGRVVRLMSKSDPANPGEQITGAGIRFLDPDRKLLSVIDRILAVLKRSLNGGG